MQRLILEILPFWKVRQIAANLRSAWPHSEFLVNSELQSEILSPKGKKKKKKKDRKEGKEENKE